MKKPMLDHKPSGYEWIVLAGGAGIMMFLAWMALRWATMAYLYVVEEE